MELITILEKTVSPGTVSLRLKLSSRQGPTWFGPGVGGLAAAMLSLLEPVKVYRKGGREEGSGSVAGC